MMFKTISQVTLDYDPQTFTSPGVVILEARKLGTDGELCVLLLMLILTLILIGTW